MQSKEPLAKQIITEMRRNWKREVWTDGDVSYWKDLILGMIAEIGEDRTLKTWQACRRNQKYMPTEADFREYIPPQEKRETVDNIAAWKAQFERERNDPEWQKAYDELKSKLRGKFAGVKVTGEFEKSRTRRDD